MLTVLLNLELDRTRDHLAAVRNELHEATSSRPIFGIDPPLDQDELAMRIFGLRSEVISFHQEIDEGGRDKHAKASGVSAPVEAGKRSGESGEHEESGAPENSAEQAITWPASEPRRLPTCRYRLPSRRQCRRLSLSPPTHTKAGAFYLRPSLNLSSTSMMPSSLFWTPEGSSSAATSSTTPTSLTIPELSNSPPYIPA
ncbi:hypothetical protein V8E36_002213 [Tilletia maclaganii]